MVDTGNAYRIENKHKQHLVLVGSANGMFVFGDPEPLAANQLTV